MVNIFLTKTKFNTKTAAQGKKENKMITVNFIFERVTSKNWDFICFMNGLEDITLLEQHDSGLGFTYQFSDIDLAKAFAEMPNEKQTEFKRFFGIKNISLNLCSASAK